MASNIGGTFLGLRCGAPARLVEVCLKPLNAKGLLGLQLAERELHFRLVDGPWATISGGLPQLGRRICSSPCVSLSGDALDGYTLGLGLTKALLLQPVKKHKASSSYPST